MYNLLLITVLGFFTQSCDTTDNNRFPIRPESPWRFEALLNGESINVEADTAWIHPAYGIIFGVHLAHEWPYRSEFSIQPGIITVDKDTYILLNDVDRLDEFEWLSSHSILYEADDDVIMAWYSLNSQDTTNYIRFTNIEEDDAGTRYRAIIEGEYEAVYYHDPRRDSQIPGLSDAWRRLPDTLRVTQGRFRTVLLDWADYDYWSSQ